ncbi:MAG TPA: LysR family transcriptional regulator [Gammaproteobacteria bacterium]|nr:LysR family transcriptional regulator [Gammaproteobacteria bacterium]
MRIRHIEVFNSIFRNGSVTTAAKLLNVSQPSVSKVLAHAEQQLGFRLFERIKMKLVPTPEAKILFKHTSMMDEVLTDINQVSERLMEFPVDRVRVSSTPSLGIEYLPNAIAEFKKQNPNVNFEISTLHYSYLRNNIKDTSLDLAIAQDQTEDEEIGTINLKKGNFVSLEPKNLDPKLIRKLPFIKLSQNSPIGRKLEKYISKKRINISSSITSDNYQMAASLVNNGFGYTILDEYTAKACRSENIQIKPLDSSLNFQITLMFLKNAPLSIPANDFIEFLTEFNYEL